SARASGRRAGPRPPRPRPRPPAGPARRPRAGTAGRRRRSRSRCRGRARTAAAPSTESTIRSTPMNAWFDRLRTSVVAERGPDDAAVADALALTGADAQALLDLARDAAHGSGARQYAPLATYLAGRLIQQSGQAADPEARARLIEAVARAVRAAGAAGP